MVFFRLAIRLATIEVRQMFDLEDFEPSPTLGLFREIGIGGDFGGRA